MTQGLSRRRVKWRRIGLFMTAACAVSLSSVLAAPALKELDPVPMVTIPAGPFLMGSQNPKGRADEWPQRAVDIDAFAIDRVEVTNERYLTFVAATGHRNPPNPYGTGVLVSAKGIEQLPVVQVTWHRRKSLLRLGQEATPDGSRVGESGTRHRWTAFSLGRRSAVPDQGEFRPGMGR